MELRQRVVEDGGRTADSGQRSAAGAKLRLGISACLLGQEVRFDGGHKRDWFLTEVLGPHVEWVAVCPEVEMGLGIPRETLRLVRDKGEPRMITTRTGVDHTDAMNAWSKMRLEALAREDLDGYVLKKNSPSCGMAQVKVFSVRGTPLRRGRGLYATALLRRLPLLPVEEEGRLENPALRESFIERVLAYRRLKELFAGRWSRDALVRFHTAHRMVLLAHSTTAYQKMGRLVARAKLVDRSGLRRKYETLFMETLAAPATRRRHTNVLLHMAGHLKPRVDAGSRRELANCIDRYRRGTIPLVVPITLIRQHVRVHGVEELAGQIYLEPPPLPAEAGSHERRASEHER